MERRGFFKVLGRLVAGVMGAISIASTTKQDVGGVQQDEWWRRRREQGNAPGSWSGYALGKGNPYWLTTEEEARAQGMAFLRGLEQAMAQEFPRMQAEREEFQRRYKGATGIFY